MPVGGAADRASLALGNALVGNPPDAPALEVCLAGPTLVADADLACVLYGVPFEAWTRRRIEAGKTFTLRAGKELTIGGTPVGIRAYLCVAGGLRGPTTLGSQSSLAPLAAGAPLECEPGRIGSRFAGVTFTRAVAPCLLRVLPGAQADLFPDGALEARTLTVTPASNRMGLRLHGEPLPVSDREMVSEPVCPGSVQVTREGQCIVLGVDGQTIGGYPKIAQVIAADLDKLGQLRPGECVTFRRVSLEEAEAQYRRRRDELAPWLTRLRAAASGC